MKKFIIIFSVVALMAIPFRPAQASLQEVSIRRFVVLSTIAACAINIQVLSIIDNQLSGNEALLLNGIVFAVFTAAIIAAGLAAGDFVLFGSPAFEAEAGITPDVMITDQQCGDLQENDEFTFRGSQLQIVSTAILVISTLAILLAIVLDLNTNAYGLFDLSIFFLTITSLFAQVLVGNINGQNAEGGGEGGGGCALQKGEIRPAMQTPWSSILLGFLSLGSLGWGYRRRAPGLS